MCWRTYLEAKKQASGQELGVVLLLSRDVCITSDFSLISISFVSASFESFGSTFLYPYISGHGKRGRGWIL